MHFRFISIFSLVTSLYFPTRTSIAHPHPRTLFFKHFLYFTEHSRLQYIFLGKFVRNVIPQHGHLLASINIPIYAFILSLLLLISSFACGAPPLHLLRWSFHIPVSTYPCTSYLRRTICTHRTRSKILLLLQYSCLSFPHCLRNVRRGILHMETHTHFVSSFPFHSNKSDKLSSPAAPSKVIYYQFSVNHRPHSPPALSSSSQISS